MIYRETSPGVFERWRGERLSNGSLLNPSDALRLSAGELEDLELFIPADADPVPDGQIVVAASVQRVAGVVKFVNELEDAPVSSPVAQPPQIKACALRVNLDEEGQIESIGGAFNVVSLIAVDVGTFWAFFDAEITDGTPYLVPNNGISIEITDWQESFCVIETRDHAGGTLLNPASFGFTLYTF